MRKRTVGLALSLLLLPLTARAHEHSAEAFFGASGESGSFLRGPHAWVDWQRGPRRFSLLLDASTHVGPHLDATRQEVTREEITALVGTRWTPFGSPGGTFVFSIHALPLGLQHVKTSNGTSATRSKSEGGLGGAFAGGVGLDVLFPTQPEDRIQVGLRGQVDFVRRYNNAPRGAWRGSVGLVVRFLHAHPH